MFAGECASMKKCGHFREGIRISVVMDNLLYYCLQVTQLSKLQCWFKLLLHSSKFMKGFKSTNCSFAISSCEEYKAFKSIN